MLVDTTNDFTSAYAFYIFTQEEGICNSVYLTEILFLKDQPEIRHILGLSIFYIIISTSSYVRQSSWLVHTITIE